MQKHKNIILGISGGIAAYKCADLVRRLSERNFNVRVVMTSAAAEFITPMTLQAVSGNPVHQGTFDPQLESAMGHIELARWADYLLIAPATANTIAKLAHGFADNLLSSIALATTAPLIVAPAMNQQMWQHTATQQNLQTLQQRGATILGPGEGEQACGDLGKGRMLEPLDIVDKMQLIASQSQLLSGKRVVITAGPTREAIDPVRYISNHSSGKMGYALASQACLAGADVTLVSGPVQLNPPEGVKVIHSETAQEMFTAVKDAAASCDIFIGCAAVADYAPVEVAAEKLKKDTEQMMNLQLKPNPDILAWVAAQNEPPYVVGFAAESQSLKAFATKKLKAKKLDLICANDISLQGLGFNSENNQLLLIDSQGCKKQLQVASKTVLARQIIEQIATKI